MSQPAKPKLRQCEECQKALPLTMKYFPRVAGTQDTFQFVCKSCKAEKKKKARLQQIEATAVTAFTERATVGGSNIPHTAELLEGIMNYFGGANGFASLLMKQYFESPPGGRIRNQIIEAVIRLASKNTEQGGARKPVSLLSEEELENEINKRLEQAVLTYGGRRYVNGQAHPEEPHTALPAPEHPEYFVLPEGRVAEFAERVEREADRSLEAIQANSAAMGVPPVHVERDAGDRGESVG